MRLKARFAVSFFLILPVWLGFTGCASSTATQHTAASTGLLSTRIAETVAAGAAATEVRLEQLALTPDISATATPTRAATATLSAMGPSPTPSITPTPSSTPLPAQPTRTPPPQPTASIPSASIQIARPGPLSRLISPLQVQGSVRPGPDGRVRIELLGEDGRLMVRKLINYGQETGWVFFSEELDFEITAVAETARLVISTYDNFGRLAWLQSVDVILLSLGQNDINPPGSDLEPIIIQEPLPNKLIQGGTLLLKGLSQLPGDQVLLVELITAAGKVVGYRQAATQANPEGGYAPFNAEIPYTVEEPTWARLTIKQNSTNRISGVVYVTSIEVLLSP